MKFVARLFFTAVILVNLLPQVFAQPSISYPAGAKVYPTGIAIIQLTLTNAGSSVTPGAAGAVTTFAGSGTSGSADNATGTLATFAGPYGIAEDASGNIYVADFSNNKIRKINTGGAVTTFAGTGTASSTDNTDATLATFNGPVGLAFDASGNLFVSEFNGHRIRKITPAGVVTTFAGTGSTGFADNTTGTSATFNSPFGLVFDASGNLYVGDYVNNKIRKITSAAAVSTFAGSGAAGSSDNTTGTLATFNNPTGIAKDASGNLYVAERNGHKIRKITAAGAVTTLAGTGTASFSNNTTGTLAAFNIPNGVAVDTAGNVYVTDRANHRIRKVTAAGAVTTFAGTGTVSSMNNTDASLATFNSPNGICLNAAGNALYIAELGGLRIRKITLQSYTISPALPSGLSFDPATGNISGTPTSVTSATTFTITALNGLGSNSTTISITTLTPLITITGTLSTVTSCIGTASAVAKSITVSGSGLIADIAVTAPSGFELATTSNGVYSSSLTLTQSGNTVAAILVFARLAATATGSLSGLIACTSTSAATQTRQIDGSVYALPTISLGTTISVGTTALAFSLPYSATTNSPNQYSITTGSPIAMSGFTAISNATLGATPISVSIPASAANTYNFNLTVRHSGTGCVSANNLFTVVVTTSPVISYTGSTQVYNLGTAITPLTLTNTGGAVPQGSSGVSTLAGSGTFGSVDNVIGTSASFQYPEGIAVDASGNVYVAGGGANKIRKISSAGAVTTIAGTGAGGSSDNAIGTLATFYYPEGIAVDGSGNLYVAEGSNKIRKISSTGVVTTIAGNGSRGSSDNTIGTLASFNSPNAIAVDASGNLYVTDFHGNKIRKISSAGVVTTIAGTGTPGSSDNTIGTLATFNSPVGICIDASGNLYVTDRGNYKIRKISSSGAVSTLAGNGYPGSTDNIIGTSATFNVPEQIAVDALGNVYVAGYFDHKVRKISPAGAVTTLAGSDNRGSLDNSNNLLATFISPFGIGVDGSGNVYVSDYDGQKIRKIIQGNYEIKPLLPAGLSFDYTNGTISGTPTTVTPSTVYTITATNANGSSSSNLTLSVITPAITIIGSLSSFKTCAGTASAPQSFSVSGTNLTAGVNVTAPTGFELASTNAGVYSSSITITQSSGTVGLTSVYIRVAATATSTTIGGGISCSSAGAVSKNIGIANRSVNVNPLPATPIIVADGPLTFCTGGKVGFTSNPFNNHINWYWENTFSATGGGFTPYPSAYGNVPYSTSYKATYTDSNGCTSAFTAPIFVTALNNPTAKITQGSQLAFSNCNATTINLNATAGSGLSYQWMNDNGNINGAVSQQYTITQIGNYRVKVTDANNCSAVSSVAKITSIPTAIASGNTSVCAGNTVSLSTGGTFTNPTYQWLKDGVAIANAKAATYDAASTGNYSVTVVSGGIGVTSCAISVTIIPLPVISVSASPGNSVCAGTPLSINATVTSSNTYQWLSGGNAIGSATQSSFNVNQSGAYSVRVTDANGCINASSEAVLTINPLPAPTAITGTTAIKVNDSTSLLTTPSGGVWSSSNTTVATVNANGVVTGIGAGKATISYTLVNASNCSATVSALVTVKAATVKPLITAGSATNFCSGGSVVLTSNGGSGNQWYKDGVVLGGATSASFTATTNGSYTVTSGIDAVSSDAVQVNVYINPAASIQQGAQLAFSNCATTSITLSAANVTPGNTYQWRNAAGDIVNATDYQYTVTQADSYSLRITDLNNCTATSGTTRVTGVPSASAGGSTVVCAGTSVPLNVNASAFTNPTYQWQNGGNNISGATDASYSPTATGNYTVVVTDGAVVSTSCSISISVNALPAVSITSDKTLCEGSTVVLSATASANAYQWLNSDNVISNATTNSYNTAISGQYSAQVTDGNGCSNKSIASNVTVNPLPLLSAISGSDTLCVNSTASFVNDVTGGTWSSSNTAVATVDVTGIVTGVGGGTSTISYTLTNNSCPSTVTKTITVNAATAITKQPVATLAQCAGTNARISAVATGINVTYQWYQNGSAITGATDTSYSSTNLTASALGNYTLIISGGCGKITSDASVWTVNPLPVVGNITGTLQVCSGLTTLLANSLAGGIWTTSNAGVATVNSSTGLVKGLTAGTASITYTVTSAFGCISAVSATPTVYPSPTVVASAPSIRVSKGLSVILTATTTGNISSYSWIPPANLSNAAISNPLARITDNTNYVVTVSTQQGCLAKDSVFITAIEDLYVNPTNVFTPNGDGINDRFVIMNLDQYPDNKLQVFDRMGKLLFEKTNYANDWDGTIGGKVLSKDTYLYILTVKGQIVKKGTITLVR